MTARAHGISTPAYTENTKKLADSAEMSFGHLTPRSTTPHSSNTTPLDLINASMFGNEDPMDKLTRSSPSIENLRQSPGIEFSKLNIKTEPPETDYYHGRTNLPKIEEHRGMEEGKDMFRLLGIEEGQDTLNEFSTHTS